MTPEGLYLKAFSGEHCRIDRKHAGSIELHRPNLSVLWLFQPDMMERLLGRDSLVASSGFVQRCLLANIPATPQHIDDHVQPVDQTIEDSWDDVIFGLLCRYRVASAETYTVQATDEARAAMVEHHNQVVDQRIRADGLTDTYLARHNEQGWRIALVLHALEHGEQSARNQLSDQTARNALRILGWFNAQQAMLLDGARRAVRRDCIERVLAFAARRLQGITARQVQQNGITSNAAYAQELLQSLAQTGRLQCVVNRPARGGRESRVYALRQNEAAWQSIVVDRSRS